MRLGAEVFILIRFRDAYAWGLRVRGGKVHAWLANEEMTISVRKAKFVAINTKRPSERGTKLCTSSRMGFERKHANIYNVKVQIPVQDLVMRC